MDTRISSSTNGTATKSTDDELKERRRLQNRIAQRNHRKRKAADKLSQSSITAAPPRQDSHQCTHCRTPSGSRPKTAASSDDMLLSPSSESLSLREYELFPLDGEIFPADAVVIHHQAQNKIGTREDDPLEALLFGMPTSPRQHSEPAQVYSSSVSEQSTTSTTPPTPRRLSSIGAGRWRHRRQTLPLHLASEKGYSAVMGVLLSNGAQPDAKDDEGKTALHYAAKNGHVEALKLLLSWGADLSASDAAGLTSLHVAAGEGHEEITRVLIDHGADPNFLVNGY